MARLLVGYDGSPPSTRALEHALARAAEGNHELHVLTVLPESVRRSSLAAMMPAGIELPPELSSTFEENARKRLLDTLEEGRRGRKLALHGHVMAGPAAATLLRAAVELKATEIVIGRKSYEGPEFTLGRNGNEILRGASVPVTVVP